MKYILPILLLTLLGCASVPQSNTDKWEHVKNLTGDALIEKLIQFGDPEIAEMKERRRNIQLEIAALAPKVPNSEEAEREQAIKKAIEDTFTQRLRELAIERKMLLWKLVNSKEK